MSRAGKKLSVMERLSTARFLIGMKWMRVTPTLHDAITSCPHLRFYYRLGLTFGQPLTTKLDLLACYSVALLHGSSESQSFLNGSTIQKSRRHSLIYATFFVNCEFRKRLSCCNCSETCACRIAAPIIDMSTRTSAGIFVLQEWMPRGVEPLLAHMIQYDIA